MSHSIALVNIYDGTVQGHKAGCADLSRGQLRRHADQAWNLEVEHKHEAWISYNIDFLNEGEESGAYDIDWKACTKHVPQGPEDTYAVWAAEFPQVEQKPVVTTKVGPKWAYIYVDGEQVAEVKSQFVDAVLLAIVTSL